MPTTDNQTMQRAEAALLRLATENAELRAANRRLRKLTANAGQGRILSRALSDATVMLAWRFAGYAISRAKVGSLGISQNRWEWARALMRAARIHDGQDVTLPDFDEALSRLVATHDRMVEHGNIDALRVRRRRRDAGKSAAGAAITPAQLSA